MLPALVPHRVVIVTYAVGSSLQVGRNGVPRNSSCGVCTDAVKEYGVGDAGRRALLTRWSQSACSNEAEVLPALVPHRVVLVTYAVGSSFHVGRNGVPRRS